MFPTLYPLGIGGFDDKDREIPVSFRAQAESYFDLSDHCFHYHRSFMFVALNIYQWHIAHLHTSLTAQFSKIAKRFATLTPTLLNSLADHLEYEKSLTDLLKKML